MNVGVAADQRKTSRLFGSPRLPLAQYSPVTQGTSAGIHHRPRRTTGWCGRLNDCLSMGSIVSSSHHQQQPSSQAKLEHQVEELEREVQKQKELRIMYRKRTERTQDYLRYCLQVAQDNGFLQFIVRNDKDANGAEPNQNLLSSPILNGYVSPQLPASRAPQPHSDIFTIVAEARAQGWYVDPHEIVLQEKVAQGTTAEVYRAMWRGSDVAVKCIFPDFFHTNQSGVAFFAQELETLSRQRHRFVLQLMGACIDPPDHAWIVTEFLGSTLKEWLHGPGNRRASTSERSTPLPPLEERLGRALEIAQGMQYLHEQKPRVIHRDLKPTNIFMDDASHARVADFGHARFLREEESALTGETGTYIYMAPEVIRCEPYDEKCDVYSFGIILNELVIGEYPYIETDFGPTKIALEVGEGKLRPALPKDEDGQLADLIQLICLSWDQDPSIRPPFSTITHNLRIIKQRLTATDNVKLE